MSESAQLVVIVARLFCISASSIREHQALPTRSSNNASCCACCFKASLYLLRMCMLVHHGTRVASVLSFCLVGLRDCPQDIRLGSITFVYFTSPAVVF